MRLTTILGLLLIPLLFISQDIVSSIDQILPDKEFENIHVKKISSDSSSSTFAIWIKQKVKLHKHVYHTENVLIDKGFGEFQINDSIYKVAAGDWIVIPKNTWHGVVVNSKSTMKVISVQSPEYFGKDRIFKD
ncbi:MAG: cupin domain-containing protein [Flavobacteriales bacterium]|nr:cupin domain-containing protein [Flavobacteriales bacterium]|tara:strand:- start:67 stop:465 length:399 start_codon:yes stop_codon:yes gene_type:complete